MTIPSLYKLSLTQTLQLFSMSRLAGAILVGVVLAKMGVDLETIGLFELLFFLGKTATAFWSDAFAKAVLPLFPKLKEKQGNHFFQTATILYVSFSFLVWIVLTIFKKPILQDFLKVEDIIYYDAYILYLALNTPGVVLKQYYTLKKNVKGLLVYTFISFLLLPLYYLIPIYMNIDLELIFSILSIVSLIKLLWLFGLLSQKRWGVDLSILRKLLKVGTHFMAYIVVGIMAEIIDGIIINYQYADPEVFAVFRYGARELPLTTALLAGLSFASVSNLSDDFKLYLPAYRKSLNRVLKITFPVALVLMLSSQWLFNHFFSPAFHESAMVFNTYLLILGTRVLMPGPLMMSKMESKYMFQVSILELALNVILSLILVRYFGIIGIAMGTVLAHYLEKIAYFVRLKRKYGVDWSETIDTKLFIAFWIALHLCYVFVWVVYR